MFFRVQDTNGCTVAHVLVVFDLMKMWDMVRFRTENWFIVAHVLVVFDQMKKWDMDKNVD